MIQILYIKIAITLQSKHVLHFSSPRYSRALESKFSNHKNKALEAKIKMLIKKRFGKDYLFPELFSKSPRSRIFSSPLNNKSREAMMKISNVYQKPLTSYHKNGFSSISKPVIFTERESKDFKSINSVNFLILFSIKYLWVYFNINRILMRISNQ